MRRKKVQAESWPIQEGEAFHTYLGIWSFYLFSRGAWYSVSKKDLKLVQVDAHVG